MRNETDPAGKMTCRKLLTGVLSSVGEPGEPSDYLIATDEDIDNLFINKDGKNG